MNNSMYVDVAAGMFRKYCEDANNKTWDDKKIPEWDELTPEVRHHWIAAAKEAVRLYEWYRQGRSITMMTEAEMEDFVKRITEYDSR